ncbi:ATP-binding protein [Occallatibacter savannae]|uniref:ATP-binding protein n=1 Tax=Occallatibacter savannae TaxID=1002691 RepID=UPI000D696E52|nr:ATP-binding protein [Occallatibacter savannae]
MKLTHRSLLLKIFLWFWATVLITGIASVLTFWIRAHSSPYQWHASLIEKARSSGETAIRIYEDSGPVGTVKYLSLLKRDNLLNACLFDRSGRVLAGHDCEDVADMLPNLSAPGVPDFGVKSGVGRVAQILKGSSGREYIFATELPPGPPMRPRLTRLGFALQWAVALFVSALVCYLLTRYLTAPIFRLREAAHQLAAGDLTTRAGTRIAPRNDELGDLVRDFDAMAARIEDLVSRQRQLISDVSHELRSPLARLNIALDMARQRKGDDPAFDQAEQDTALLDEMIGRLLTIAKLDVSAREIPMVQIELAEVVTQIARNANFESHANGDRVKLMIDNECLVYGNPELLHSAIENIVRNAISYTDPGTQVDLHLSRVSEYGQPSARIEVRDHGPGVPESELTNIFRPFYRVAVARDRQSGGAGLGLAISDRVIRAHAGTIRALNASPNGLLIEILIPEQPAGSAGSSSEHQP